MPLMFPQLAATLSSIIFASLQSSCISVWSHQSGYLMEKWVYPLLYEILTESLVTLPSIIIKPYDSRIPFCLLCMVFTKRLKTLSNLFDIHVSYRHGINGGEKCVCIIRPATNRIFSLSNKVIVLVFVVSPALSFNHVFSCYYCIVSW
jgi:hypothetical protein